MKNKDYVSILGIKTALIPIPRKSLQGLNTDLLVQFYYYFANFNGQDICLIEPKDENKSISPMRYKRMTEQIESIVRIPTAVMLASPLIYIQRERMIRQGVYFIVSDKYAFLPSLIVNAQMKKREKLKRLTPAAQYLFIQYLLEEGLENEFTIKDLEKKAPYNYVALARAVVNLEDCGLCTTKTTEGTKTIHFIKEKRALWEKALPILSSPVKRIVYSDIFPEGPFCLSGTNALARYSHLNPDKNETWAIWEKDFKLPHIQYNVLEGLYKIEIWKYPTYILSQTNEKIVDKLSLCLTMKDNPDARIENEITNLIEGMRW